jgi:transcriptional regulator of acetoin/glycerol metabolism
MADAGRLAGGADERTRILTALTHAGGNRSAAARLLGISRATLYRKLALLGIAPEEPGTQTEGG